MTGDEVERLKAAGDARRDVHGRGGQLGTVNRYDALLRYLRGLYVRTSNDHHGPESPESDPAAEAEGDPAEK